MRRVIMTTRSSLLSRCSTTAVLHPLGIKQNKRRTKWKFLQKTCELSLLLLVPFHLTDGSFPVPFLSNDTATCTYASDTINLVSKKCSQSHDKGHDHEWRESKRKRKRKAEAEAEATSAPWCTCRVFVFVFVYIGANVDNEKEARRSQSQQERRCCFYTVYVYVYANVKACATPSSSPPLSRIQDTFRSDDMFAHGILCISSGPILGMDPNIHL